MDLGMNDTFSIGFFQIDLYGKPKIIGEYMNSGYGLSHYWDMFQALSKKFGWVHGSTYVPHDSKVRELIADKTRWVAMKELGFKPVLVTKHRIQDGIEATRQFLVEVEIDPECEVIIGAVQNYRKRYDKKFNVYLDAPVHDEWSHTADMIRYMAMGCKHKLPSLRLVQEITMKTNTRLISKGFDV
jgi:isocitrate lyase